MLRFWMFKYRCHKKFNTQLRNNGYRKDFFLSFWTFLWTCAFLHWCVLKCYRSPLHLNWYQWVADAPQKISSCVVLVGTFSVQRRSQRFRACSHVWSSPAQTDIYNLYSSPEKSVKHSSSVLVGRQHLTSLPVFPPCRLELHVFDSPTDCWDV